jgi:hypothetical protein
MPLPEKSIPHASKKKIKKEDQERKTSQKINTEDQERSSRKEKETPTRSRNIHVKVTVTIHFLHVCFGNKLVFTQFTKMPG